jgi:hypothetical protein
MTGDSEPRVSFFRTAQARIVTVLGGIALVLGAVGEAMSLYRRSQNAWRLKRQLHRLVRSLRLKRLAHRRHASIEATLAVPEVDFITGDARHRRWTIEERQSMPAAARLQNA